ncbi:MAG TPA: hypothetical protein VFT50_07860 [Baekduia sp.]|nr:hypothetical protein [Baekduia sp.]
MARRSLRPHLNQIRTWVRQGRTDAWIAHQLEVTVQQIEAFKKENELLPDGEVEAGAAADFDGEIDLRAEDDALIAAELEAEAARKAEEEARKAEEAARKAEDEEEAGEEDEEAPKRRRGRRGGRTRRTKKPATFEASFDHGDEGYGLWLDPAVADDGIYAEHWAGQRQIEVTIEPDQIVIKRVGDAADSDDD